MQLPYVIEEDILYRMWGKWMLNVGVNQVVMIHEGTYRTIQQPVPEREEMIAAMAEVLKIANQTDYRQQQSVTSAEPPVLKRPARFP